jgi:hypothetical protein
MLKKTDNKLTVPVLLVAFNRPNTTEKVFAKIRDAKPSKLFVALDGPRDNRQEDIKLVNDVKKIVKKVDWDCEVKYKFNTYNLGAEVTVSTAISWALENDKYVIILEDDILAPMSFFKFAEEMLIRYENEPKVGMVSGCNFSPLEREGQSDYLFSKYGHIWGWATWKRAWEFFDLNINDFDETLRYKNLRSTCESFAETQYFIKRYKKMAKKGGGKNAWDYCWGYIHRTRKFLAIVPRVNLTSNIGIYGLHSRGKTHHHFRSYDKYFKVLKHPDEIAKDTEYDKYHFKNYIKKNKMPLKKKIKNKLNRIFSQK